MALKRVNLIGVGVAIGFGAMLYFGYREYENRSGTAWLASCETAFLDRIISPATYKRRDAKLYQFAMTPEEYMAGFAPRPGAMGHETRQWDQRREEWKANPPNPINWQWVVEFDAQNLHGAVIRGDFTCDSVTATGYPPRRIDPSDAKVDGLDNHEWLMQEARRAGLLVD
ncbi:hypothetical protein [Gemmobacter lutimaris]|uniref:hypothetical protein n=1 Tax=Gemmobacter lutimaris TaxID=2306023 RepID=UPI0011C43020|nr:hypothetical protein [Gemmobacter lutimaris]